MMDRAYVIENSLVDRYLRGELTPREQEAFEAYYIGDPETLEELQACQALMSCRIDTDGNTRRLRWPGLLPSLAIAAALVATLFLLKPADQSLTNLQLVPIEAVRSNAARRVAVDPVSQYLLLRAYVPDGTPVPVPFSMTIRSGSGQVVHEGLQPGAGSELSVALPVSSLESGLVTVEVRDAGGSLVLAQNLELELPSDP